MGALTSLLAAHQGYNVLWLGPEERGRADGADARNYALAPLTVDLLKRVGAWGAIAPYTCTVSRMEVFSEDTRIDLSATDAGADFLSMMVLHRDLLQALETAVQFRPTIQRIHARPDRMQAEPATATVSAQGKDYSVQLIIGADGARSWVRAQSGILWGQRDYGQQGVVATLALEHPHGGVATQWFDRGDILALLPLRDPHQVSMEWSTGRANPTSSEAIEEFIGQIQERSQGRFGQVRLVDQPAAAPLRMLVTDSQSALRTCLVGDAAHTVHPLAGYGLNLGVQDLMSLEELLKEATSDPGASSVLAAYDKARRLRVKRVQWGLDLLQRTVTASHPTFSRLRGLGMKLVGDIGPLRQFLIRQAISPQ